MACCCRAAPPLPTRALLSTTRLRRPNQHVFSPSFTATASSARHLIRIGRTPVGLPVLYPRTSTRKNPSRISCSAASGESDPSPPHISDARSSPGFQQWDVMTARFAGASNIPFLVIQIPQIILNARNLLAGNNSALFAVPWLGMFTGLLGNLTLLSYFAKKKETEAIVVQTLGVISLYAVIAQLAMAGAMPLPLFIATSVVVAAGLLLNFWNYFGWLGKGAWSLWEDFITVAGLSVLPQVMWSTFVPFVPNSILPGLVSLVVAVAAVVMARKEMLPEKGSKFVLSLSGWTATLLFMWMAVAQMWTNHLNPENIRGLSATTMMLAMIGNGLMIPRALFIRDLMWFTGASWASFLYGWFNLLCLYRFQCIGKEFFFTATLTIFTWLGLALWNDSRAYGFTSPFQSLRELVSVS